MKTPILSLLTTAFLIAACSGSSSSNQPLVPSAVKVNQPVRTDGITFKVERSVALEEDLSNLESFERGLNIYSLTIQIPSTLSKDLKIRKLLNGEPIQFLDESSYQYSQDHVTISDLLDLKEQKLLTQNFEYEIESDSQRIQPVSFSIKPDLVISGSRTLSSVDFTNTDIEIGTLFIDSQSSLITEGASISVSAETIISKEGSIETFTEAAAAIPSTTGVKGKSGGNLKFATNLLVGNLNIFMRGQKGGQGAPVARRTETRDQAAPGQESSVGSRCMSWTRLAPPMELALREFPPTCEIEVCSKHATDGQPGLQGIQGHQGSTGAQGGDSGTVLFVAAKSNQSKVNVKLLPGAGGNPSEPGKGGAGGLGGPGGASRNSTYCPPGKQGPDGPPGEDGPAGVAGKSGEEQKPTITLNGKTE